MDASTRTIEYARWRTAQILAAEHGKDVVEVPSRATFYRLFAKLSGGVHVTGSARTRRSLADQPEGPFRYEQVAAPGELMQIDSTPLDVLVRLDEGMPGRVELCGLVDVATRTIAAAVIRPTTKSVDASLLLARTLTPEPMRPGWIDALRMSRSVLPHRRLLSLDERLEHAAARPVIIPETIVCDRGKAFISENFRSACRALEITFQPCHPRSPAEQPHIERTLESVATMFCQFLPGYLGRTSEHRGRNVEDEPLWSMLEIQEFLDEWLVAKWQNRHHDGLRDPGSPGRTFTPNEKYASLIESAGYVPSPWAPTTMSSSCPRPGEPSTPTKSRSTTASTTTRSWGPSGASPPESPANGTFGRSIATPTTPTGSGSATTGKVAGSLSPGNTSAPSRSPSVTWPGTTLQLTCANGARATRPRSRSPKQSWNS
ncbi:transposase family protein [Streptomyces griseoviridis]